MFALRPTAHSRRMRATMTYTRKQLAVMAYTFGLLTGLIVGLASCSPPDSHDTYSHTTEDGFHE